MVKLHTRSILIVLVALFFAKTVVAQDTLRVKTFTWDNPARSQFFDFPNDPSESFRKIWMVYNMRCHNAAVGNGNVGCYEWDYSCNTFLYDESRQDSLRATHPSVVVGGFSGTSFPYSVAPTFTYYQYQQHQTDLTIGNPIMATVGNGMDIWSPIHAGRSKRVQFLVLAAELQAAGLQQGPIEAMNLLPSTSTSTAFLTVGLSNSSLSALNPAFPQTTGLQRVFFQHTDWVAGAEKSLNFYAPFMWDGNSNILVDLSYTKAQGSTAALELTGSSLAGTRVLASNTDDYSLNFLGSGGVRIPGDDFSTISNEITISLWTYGNPAVLPANTFIFEGFDAQGNRQASAHLPWSDGSVYFDCGNTGNGYDRINKAAAPAEFEGAWNHWAFTKNATNGEMKIFLNGQLWHSATGRIKPIQIDSFHLAANQQENTGYHGRIDEFQVWNKALDAATIRAWMYQKINPSHPNYANLQVYFDMNEGNGSTLTNLVSNQAIGKINLPYFQLTQGKDVFKDFSTQNTFPKTTFLQGTPTRNDQIVTVLDSVLNLHHGLTYYGVNGSDLVVTGTAAYYPAGAMSVFGENGSVVSTLNVPADGTIQATELAYFRKSPAKFEILSLVTPYGNGLDLGAAGKIFVFDVTDFGPILRGNKRLSIEMGGENQEELDIEFLFIRGTPTREVKNIQHIWPFQRGSIDQILANSVFEPRQIPTDADGDHFKLRTSITGHDQNGEFQPRSHFLNVNSGGKKFDFDVWKECADNPIYPQGGTWIFDRAGWCPGAATDIHEYDITPWVNPGQPVSVDYGINGTTMASANYLVAGQLVTYGAYNFSRDAALERIARPNAEHVEFERINPACSAPILQVRNTGSAPISSLKIAYWVHGNGEVKEWDWMGMIQPDELQEIGLPLAEVGFWETNDAVRIFEAAILKVNGQDDQNAANDRAKVRFNPVQIFVPENEYHIVTRTNNNAFQNSFTLRDAAGQIVLERSNLAANTLFRDILNLAPGCYSFQFLDTGEDGLNFWFYPNNGTGSVRFIRKVGNADIPVRTFNADFGKILHYDFTVAPTVSAEEPQQTRVFSVFPNPATDWVQVDLKGFQGERVVLELTDMQGKIVFSKKINEMTDSNYRTELTLSDLPKGMYFLRLHSGTKVWAQKIARM